MGATNVVRLDLQTGHAVCLGLVAQDDIADLLVGIGLVGAGFDANHSAEHGSSFAGQSVLVKQIARRAGLGVILKGALVDHLLAAGDVDRKHVAAGAFRDHAAVALAADELASQVDLHTEAGGIASDRGGVEMKRGGGEAPLLHGHIVELGAFLDDQVVDPAGESGCIVRTTETIDDGRLALALADHEGVRENGGIFTLDPVENFDGQNDLEIFRDANEDAVDRTGAVQGGVFGRAELGLVRHEMFFHQIGVFARRLFKGHDDEPGLDQFRSGSRGGKQAVVPENETGGGLAKTGRATDQRGGIGHRGRIAEAVQGQGFDLGETPLFVLRRRRRELFKVRPATLTRGDEPFGPLALDKGAFHQGYTGNGCRSHDHDCSSDLISRPSLPSQDR